MRNWMADLSSIPKESIKIEHNPPTSRYIIRASRALGQVVKQGQAIGYVDLGSSTTESHLFEVVIWVEPLNNGEFGWYAVFRVYYDNRTQPKKPTKAVLFCFYDGTDQGCATEKKGFRSRFAAVQFMKKTHPEYMEVTND